MKLAVQKNHLCGQILYRSLDPSKKRRQFPNFLQERDQTRSTFHYFVENSDHIPETFIVLSERASLSIFNFQ